MKVVKAIVVSTGDDYAFLRSQDDSIDGDIFLHKEIYPKNWDDISPGKTILVLVIKKEKGQRVSKVLTKREFVRLKLDRK